MQAVTIPPTRTHRQLAQYVNRTFPKLIAIVVQSYSNTDRKLPGTRLIHPGKGRRGLRLTVMTRDSRHTVLFEHDMSETYRSHDEARKWVQQWADNKLHITEQRWGSREEFVAWQRRR